MKVRDRLDPALARLVPTPGVEGISPRFNQPRTIGIGENRQRMPQGDLPRGVAPSVAKH